MPVHTRDAPPDLSPSAVSFSAAALSPVPAATRCQRYRAERRGSPQRTGLRIPYAGVPSNTALESPISLPRIAVSCSVLLLKIQSSFFNVNDYDHTSREKGSLQVFCD